MRFPVSVLLLATLAAFACMDPASPRLPPNDRDRSLVLFMVLDPDEVATLVPGGQGLWVTTAFVQDSLAPPDWEFHGVDAILSSPGAASVQGQPADRGCYGGDFPAAATCMRFPGPIRYGATYSVTVSADSFPTATASANVPGDFKILDHEANGSPPGTAGLSVSWTPSAGAYRYLVTLRAESTPECYPYCWNGWSAIAESTSFTGSVPAAALSKGLGPWLLDVYALDRHLYEYLSSGTGGPLFSVAPTSNVQNGYGVVGAWVRRSVPVP
ncbi:MAG: DUF4249 family protein [Gemmatimonadota bacterium]